jgi:Na+/proline symporter
MGFVAFDWFVLTVYIAISVLVGVLAPRLGALHRRCSSTKKRAIVAADDKKFFLGEAGSTSALIVAVSLVSGLTSGISFLGSPAYTYTNGAAIMFGLVGYGLSVFVTAFGFIPFFVHVASTFAGDSSMSSFAYLEWRFSSRARRVCALLFVLRTALYLAVVLLAPARAMQAVNPDFSMVLSICVGGAVATAYTVVGGMSAVIYTDLLQSITLIAAMIGAIAVCCHALSAARIASPATWRWEVGAAWAFPGALEPGAESSGPWYVLGTFFQAIGQSGCDQIAVQRYLSLRGEEGGAAADGRAVRRAQRSAIGTGVLNTAVSAALSFLGILIGAYYSQSGPGANAAPQLASGDELLPWFFLNGPLPVGASGALSAAILGCTMSVFAGGLNSAATTAVVDLFGDRVLWFTPSPPRAPQETLRPQPAAVSAEAAAAAGAARDEPTGGRAVAAVEAVRRSAAEEGAGAHILDAALLESTAASGAWDTEPQRCTPRRAPCTRSVAAKVLTALCGALATSVAVFIALVLPHSSLIELCTSALGATLGPVVGVFIVGMTMPRAGRVAGEVALGTGLAAMIACAVMNGVRPGAINAWLLCPLLTLLTALVGALVSLCAPPRRAVDERLLCCTRVSK